MAIQEGDARPNGLTSAMKITLGNKSRAATILLGTSKRAVIYKVHKYNINLKHFWLMRSNPGKRVQKLMPSDGKERNSADEIP